MTHDDNDAPPDVSNRVQPGSTGFNRVQPGSTGFNRVQPGSTGFNRVFKMSHRR
ncbi:MAG: DUF1720 domain-containing protein [Betaproteobacteria bacterium]|nr:DUF1720 domain-containing protein [Betaproteobacteria bacterium]